MDLTPEILGTGAIGLLIVLGALGQYLKSLRAAPPVIDPALRMIGAELGSREQMERVIEQLKRIADAFTDKNTAGINERIDNLAETVERLLSERPPPAGRRRR